MFKQTEFQHSFRNDLEWGANETLVNDMPTFEVTGTGELKILNTGGSSAGDGGMGSGSDDDREKGDLSKAGDKGGNAIPNEESDEGWDPIKKSIKEAEKEHRKD